MACGVMGDEGVCAVGDRSSVVPEAVTVGGGLTAKSPETVGIM